MQSVTTQLPLPTLMVPPTWEFGTSNNMLKDSSSNQTTLFVFKLNILASKVMVTLLFTTLSRMLASAQERALQEQDTALMLQATAMSLSSQPHPSPTTKSLILTIQATQSSTHVVCLSPSFGCLLVNQLFQTNFTTQCLLPQRPIFLTSTLTT